ncbi:hypothetical protein M5689_000163 [Euphorbia peplus]|nr:hypothetical protein M5689_000163 [Euphorbia peplus]
MPEFSHLRRVFHLQSALLDSFRRSTMSSLSAANVLRSNYATGTEDGSNENEKKGKWFTLPPYTSTISGSSLGRAIAASKPDESGNETTALKWILRCCPELPRNLVQKLFRLRQVRRESSNQGDQGDKNRVKRVAAKDLMHLGDRIFLPNTVIALRADESEKQHRHYNDEEVNFVRSLELYKDEAIIVLNKPPGLPVQGGVGIKISLDELAECLSYDCSEPPRLVHRLDRDSSGILVMGRTQTSTTVLHSIFREKTFAASNDDIGNQKRILQRKYWALVLGSPRREQGLISAPLGKVVVDNGKSDRITVVENGSSTSSQHAVTQYRVIESSHGFTWLELSPITGRKHQLRVHCAEVLGTPIVGDYKYGWQTHRKWQRFPSSDIDQNLHEKPPCEKILPFGIDLKSGSISEKSPRLHLHCKQMVLPDVSQALKGMKISSDYNVADLKSIELDSPLPDYMKRSWELLRS